MPPLLTFHHQAMATTFEIVIGQEDDIDATYAGQAAQAAFAEIDRLEDELSRFRSTSDIWRVNNLLAGQKATVGLAALDCLILSKAVQQETAGAFDISVGPLMKIFRNEDGTPRSPSPEEEEYARRRVGTHVFEVDEETSYVLALVDYPLLDLGAVGKGYALDQAASVLLEWSVPNALLNAGDSSVLAMGAPAGEEGWCVTVGNKNRQMLRLTDRAVSGSGFQVQGNHIMNPRTLKPVPVKAERVWASAPTAALSDALSTAFTIMSAAEIEAFCRANEEVYAVLD